MVFDITNFGISIEQLPNGWVAERLDTLAFLNPEQIGTDYPHSEIAYLDIANVERGLIGRPVLLPLTSAPSRAKRIVRPGDTILSTVRPGNRAYAFLLESPDNLVVSTGFVVLRARPGKADPRFVYYVATSDPLINYLASIAEEKTAYPSVNPGDIAECVVPIPVDPAEQNAIGLVLGTLDEKIELNHRMNETLEAISRAIFKSWFVDFDPVHAKASGEPIESICRRLGLTPDLLALFPDRFQGSERGEIPEGWETAPLEQLTTYLNRGVSPKYVDEGGVLVLNQKCVRDGRVDTTMARRHDPTQRAIEGRLLQVGDVVVNSTGVGTLGRVAQVLVVDEPTIVDSHITIVRADPEKISWNYLGVALLELQVEIEALGEGSTGQTELSRARLGTLSILRPPNLLREYFDDCVIGLRLRASNNSVQSITLASIRDTLLPKLISGELRVPVTGGA